MSPFSSNTNPATWQEAVKQLDESEKEFKKLYGIMTPMEKSFVSKQITEAREKYRKSIEDGVIGELTQAQNVLKAKLDAVEFEKTRVINSFSGPELAAQMQIYSMRVDHAAKSGDLDALKAIREEAQQSGDKTKMRACAEALQSVTAKFPAAAQDSHGNPANRSVNLLEKSAIRDLAQLQDSPELQEAHKAAAQAVQQLDDARRQMGKANDVMSDYSLSLNQTLSIPLQMSFEKALERCTQDESGNFHFEEN